MADYYEPTELEKAYAAGLFDGEGCVALYMKPASSTKNAFSASLNVGNTDVRPLEWLQERWSGSICFTGTKWRRDRGYQPCGRWAIYSAEAERFARDLRPYLRIKGEQIDLWLQARSLTRPRGHQHGGLSEVEVAERLDLVDRIKQLKKVS